MTNTSRKAGNTADRTLCPGAPASLPASLSFLSHAGKDAGAPGRLLASTRTALGRALGVTAVVLKCTVSISASTTHDDWPYYGHDAGGMRYSPLAQINRENVPQLKVAWVFHTGDISDGRGRKRRSGFETTPLLVDGALFLTTPFNRVIALDPEKGTQRWAYDPKIDLTWDYGDGLINRGVATWWDPDAASAKPGKSPPVRLRIFEATLDARLIALDAATGAPCSDFGKRGQVSLREVARYRQGQYHMTSPPAVIDDLVVVGSAIDNNARAALDRQRVGAYGCRTRSLPQAAPSAPQ